MLLPCIYPFDVYYCSKNWDEFYLNSNYKNYKHRSERLNAKENSYFVSFCHFVEVKQDSTIYVRIDNSDFLSEDCCCIKCSTPYTGAYIQCFVGQCVLNRVYSSKSEGSHGVFCQAYVADKSNSTNYIYESSIAESGVGTGLGYSNIILFFGAPKAKSNNISNTYIKQTSIHSISSFSPELSVSYCSYVKNKQIEYLGEYYFSWNTNNKVLVNSCNYIDNLGGTNLVQVFNATASFKQCNFKNENFQYDLFDSRHGSITVDGCFFDRVYSRSFGSVIVKNKAGREINLGLLHITEYMCDPYPPVAVESIVQHKHKTKYISNFIAHIVSAPE